MNSFAKGVAIVLGPEDGEAFWQPLPSRGYVINKITPYTSPYDNFSAGIQVLEPGAHIRRHGHERSHEILFCFRGSGTAEIDGKIYDVHEETMMLIGRGLQHKVTNTGPVQMRLMWFISPAGLEDWFRALDRPRQPGETLPPAFERPANIKEIQAQQRFIPSEEG
jgi:mannose-6-phosphate isomerase-like protein (cupin superfamily)